MQGGHFAKFPLPVRRFQSLAFFRILGMGHPVVQHGHRQIVGNQREIHRRFGVGFQCAVLFAQPRRFPINETFRAGVAVFVLIAQTHDEQHARPRFHIFQVLRQRFAFGIGIHFPHQRVKWPPPHFFGQRHVASHGVLRQVFDFGFGRLADHFGYDFLVSGNQILQGGVHGVAFFADVVRAQQVGIGLTFAVDLPHVAFQLDRIPVHLHPGILLGRCNGRLRLFALIHFPGEIARLEQKGHRQHDGGKPRPKFALHEIPPFGKEGILHQIVQKQPAPSNSQSAGCF